MAGNIFLFLEGIPGESTNGHFRNWIDVMSFSIGATMEIDQEARMGGGGTSTSGAADPEDISLDTKMSVASPVLLECCASGAVIPRGRLIQCNMVNRYRTIVSEYAFGDSIISGVSLSGSGGEIPSESISINYGSIIWKYNCFGHFNPLFQLGDACREWSILRTRAGKADPNAHIAAQILGNQKVLAADTDDKDEIAAASKIGAYQGSYSYQAALTDIGGPDVTFKHANPINMYADKKK